MAATPSGMVELYRAVTGPGGQRDVEFLLGGAGVRPAARSRARAGRSARAQSRAIGPRRADARTISTAAACCSARRRRSSMPTATPIGAVVVSDHLGADVRVNARRATTAFESLSCSCARSRSRSSPGTSRSLPAVTLLILVSATWLGLYLCQAHHAARAEARRGRARDRRRPARLPSGAGDERRAGLARRGLQHDGGRAPDQSRAARAVAQAISSGKNIEVDARRRYIETILERVATGVISLDAAGRISTVNGAAERLLGLGPTAIGQPAAVVLAREDLAPLLPLVRRHLAARAAERRARKSRWRATTARSIWRRRRPSLTGEDGQAEGAVLVLDDVTPLIRAQRVAAWRDVARRLAHEIKNPLTPIQLSAERLRRHFAGAAPPTWTLVDECTGAIVTEVEALKGLVDEFAQFARLRGPRMLPVDLNRLIDDTLQLYGGVLQQGTLHVERDLAPGLPPVRLDAEQIRQVIINLVDNAIEALGGPTAPPRPDGEPPTIRVATTFDDRNGRGAAGRDRQRSRRAAGRSRQAVHAVLLDQGPGQRPGARDRPPHRRRARRRHRGRRRTAHRERSSRWSCRRRRCLPS